MAQTSKVRGRAQHKSNYFKNKRGPTPTPRNSRVEVQVEVQIHVQVHEEAVA